MKKKIVFMVINMNIGGTEKALLSMIDEIDRSKWNITILMIEEYGGFLSDIPEGVTVKYVDEFKELKALANNPPLISAKVYFRNGEILKSINVLYHYGISKVFGNATYWYKYLLRNVKALNEEYDVAVAYAGPMDFITYFVHEKISAKKKIQWIHFDVTKVAFSKGLVKKLYPKFHKICVVSEEGKEKLDKRFPELKESTMVFHNVISKQKILQLADREPSFQDNYDGIRILTVGRLSWEKGQDLIIPVLAKLKLEGHNVRWYCIGDGAYREQCSKLIKNNNIEKDFILLGIKKNPYPYMKDCDIYVQPSRHEGYCITLAEARCFDKVIVTTDFTGAREQIEHKKTGMVCSCDEESIYKAIKELLDNNKLTEMILENSNCFKMNNLSDICKLEALLN